MNDLEAHLGDALIFDVPVTYDGGPQDGAAVPLDGATVEASAARRGVTVAATAEVEGGTGNVIAVAFAAGDLSAPGDWLVQVRVTLGPGSPQTVLSEVATILPIVF